MNKKVLSIFILILTLTFTTQALASFTFSSSAITGAGATSVNTGSLLLSGSTSGTVTIAPAAAAGTYTLTLPTTAGTASQFLQTDGSGTLTWATVADPSPAGDDTQVQFNDGGAFAGDAGFTYDKNTYAATLSGSINASNIYATGNKFAIGETALNRAPTMGYNNTLGIGKDVFPVIDGNGNYNIGIGLNIAPEKTMGGSNILIGTDILSESTNSAADNIIAIGHYALPKVNADNNIAIGNLAMVDNVNGTSNIAIGNSALTNVLSESNTAIGHGSLLEATQAYQSVALGNNAGYSVTTGYNNTFVGYSADFDSSTQWSNSTAIGYNARVDANNTVVLGNNNVTDVLAGTYAQAKFKGGALQLVSGAKPTCDATTRGTIWYVAGATNVADTGEMCRKDASNAYAWVTLY